MQGENRFIKLLLFSTAGGEVLLYGFSSPTNQPFLTWKQREISKKHQSVLTAILPFHEAEIFEKSLTQESTLSMAKITMKSPQLVIRPMVLVNDTHSRQHGCGIRISEGIVECAKGSTISGNPPFIWDRW